MRGEWLYRLKYFTWLHYMGRGGYRGSGVTASNISLGYMDGGEVGIRGTWLYHVKYFIWLPGVGRVWGGMALPRQIFHLVTWGGEGWGGSDFTTSNISLGYMIWGREGLRGKWLYRLKYFTWLPGVGRVWGGMALPRQIFHLVIWDGAGLRGTWLNHLKYFTWPHDMGWSGDEGTWLYRLKYFTWPHDMGWSGDEGTWLYRLKYFTSLHDMGWSGDEGEVVLPPQIFHLVTWYEGGDFTASNISLGAGMRGNGDFTASNISLGYLIWGGAGMRGKWCYHLKYFTWLHDMGWSGDEGEVVLPPQIFHLVTWYGAERGLRGTWLYRLKYFTWLPGVGLVWEGMALPIKYFTWLYGVGRGWGGSDFTTSNISLGYMIWGGAGLRGKWLYRLKYFTWLPGVGRVWGGMALPRQIFHLVIWGGAGLNGVKYFTWLNHLKYFTWLHDMGWGGVEGEVTLPPQIFLLVIWGGGMRGNGFTASNISLGYMGWGGVEGDVA